MPEPVYEPTAIRYGDSRRAWSKQFVQYMQEIIDHPNYQGMPCTHGAHGAIDWTIPSNRSRGSSNWDGNARRRDWWREKAKDLGIEEKGHWLSRVAKAIHPFGKKPCQPCGRVMEIAYAYPRALTIEKVNRYLPARDQLDPADLLVVDELVVHCYDVLGVDKAFDVLISSFPLTTHYFSEAQDENAMIRAIRAAYVEKESRLFSPGAMSNAPDRLDGFHTYNLCCRRTEDTGRTSSNLRTYSVDRRAYEQWCEGDWAAADALMHSVGEGDCQDRCGYHGQLTADHVGPISLGFQHSTNFRAICLRCNSSKNNRLSHADVERLRRRELVSGVISWQASALWEQCKDEVASDEDALRLSKLLRILQHHYLESLYLAVLHEVPDVLLQFLHPEYANFETEFLQLDPATLTFSGARVTERGLNYARLKARRAVRIAFESLFGYAKKGRRNIQRVDPKLVADEMNDYLQALKAAAGRTSDCRNLLIDAITSSEGAEIRDEMFGRVLEGPATSPDRDVERTLGNLMTSYANVLTVRFRRGEAVSWGDFETE